MIGSGVGSAVGVGIGVLVGVGSALARGGHGRCAQARRHRCARRSRGGRASGDDGHDDQECPRKWAEACVMSWRNPTRRYCGATAAPCAGHHARSDDSTQHDPSERQLERGRGRTRPAVRGTRCRGRRRLGCRPRVCVGAGHDRRRAGRGATCRCAPGERLRRRHRVRACVRHRSHPGGVAGGRAAGGGRRRVRRRPGGEARPARSHRGLARGAGPRARHEPPSAGGPPAGGDVRHRLGVGDPRHPGVA